MTGTKFSCWAMVRISWATSSEVRSSLPNVKKAGVQPVLPLRAVLRENRMAGKNWSHVVCSSFTKIAKRAFISRFFRSTGFEARW